jgi:hypothetical protein
MKELMPHANPPRIFRTPDNIEWTFIKTLSDFDKMNDFRRKKLCKAKAGKQTQLRIRFSCGQRFKKSKCPFMLLALKTTKQGYHVYKHGEHNEHTLSTGKGM